MRFIVRGAIWMWLFVLGASVGFDHLQIEVSLMVSTVFLGNVVANDLAPTTGSFTR
jgi:hypothetical protein